MALNLRGVKIENVEKHFISDVNPAPGLDQPPFIDVLDRVTLKMTLPDKDCRRGLDKGVGEAKPSHIRHQERLAEAMTREFGEGVLTVDRGLDPRVVFAIWTLVRKR